MNYIILAENASTITLNGLSSLKKPPRINESKGLVLLLLAKAAKNVRLAAIGLRIGYYSGASAVIRSSFESLLYAALFDSEPRQIEDWFINEFSSKSKSEVNAFHESQISAAKQALLDYEKSRLVIKDAMREFLEKANQSLHTSMRGLSEEFGIDIEFLLPDDFQEEYEKAGFDLALSKYALLRRYGKKITLGESYDGKDELLQIHLDGMYQTGTLSDLALFNFYVAHRILDMAKSCFEIEDEEFKEQFRLWHKQINEIEPI